MSKFTAEEVERLVNEAESEDSSREGVYYQLHWGEDVEVEGLGTVKHVDSYGGEGQGDDYWVVFEVGNQLFKKNGWYASYDGGELDGDLYEVKAVQVSRTEYEKK